MAFFDVHVAWRPPGLLRRLARVVDTPFDARQRQIAARVAALRALSDDDLAARGLRRDMIIPHVFASVHVRD